MEKRPTIDLALTPLDKIIEIAGIMFLVALWLLAILTYTSLPENIPIHYNALGEVDNYGPKSSIYLLPIIGSLLFAILTVVNKHPEDFNYGVSITAENAEKQYQNATRMIRFLKLVVMVVFLIIDIHTVYTVKGKSIVAESWLMPIVLGLILIPLGYFTYRSYTLKNNQ